MPKENFDVDDFTSHADADDALEDGKEDLGSELTADEDGEEGDKAKKAPAKKAPAKKSAEKPADEESEEEDGDEEEDEEGEEEDEEEEPEKDTEREKLAKKLARVGRARSKLETQVNELRNQLDAQNRERSDTAKQKLDQLTKELDDLYEKVEEFRAEGKTGEAAKAQRRIDELRDNMTRSQAAALALTEAIRQTEVRAYNNMVQELEVLEPRLDPDHDDFDQDLLDSVGELTEGYEAKGMPLTDALRKACKLLLREDVFAKARSLARKVPDREKEVEKPKKRMADVQKNLNAAKKQPPDNPNRRGERETQDIDMATISEKDFDALPEATLRRLLGSDG